MTDHTVGTFLDQWPAEMETLEEHFASLALYKADSSFTLLQRIFEVRNLDIWLSLQLLCFNGEEKKIKLS